MTTHNQTAAASGEKGRLRWQCRRGMKELDTVLLQFLEHDYEQAEQRFRDAFCRILEMPDPQIFDYLLGRQTPETSDLRHVIDSLSRHRP
jgi:antitoxin CptB